MSRKDLATGDIDMSSRPGEAIGYADRPIPPRQEVLHLILLITVVEQIKD
jgi:hypothetical protein